MYGRNGGDELFRFMSIAALVPLVISIFVGGQAKTIISTIAVLLLVLTYFRAFSKNLAARRGENAKFVGIKQKGKSELKLRRDMWNQRKDHKFFKCSSCKAVLRVPRGKGKIRIVCRKCGSAFERRT